MTREDAKIFLYSVAGDLGFINVENYTCQDGEKMREAIKVLEEPRDVFDEYGNYKYPSDVELTESNTATSMPCEDAISRQAVLDILWHTSFRDDYEYKVCKNKIIELPSVNSQKPTGHWTPVSERLPEDGTYLVTAERIVGEPRVEIKSFAKDLNKVDEFDFPNHKCGWYDYDSEYGYWEDTNVIAWMPLPKPYEPQERSGKE